MTIFYLLPEYLFDGAIFCFEVPWYLVWTATEGVALVWSDLPLQLFPTERPWRLSRAYIRGKVGALGRLKPQLVYIGQGGKTLHRKTLKRIVKVPTSESTSLTISKNKIT